MVNLTSLVEFKSLPPLRPQNSPNHIIYMKTKTKKEKNKIIVKKAKPTSSDI